jgi:hypothetical protein
MEKFMRFGLAVVSGLSAAGVTDHAASEDEIRVRITVAVILGIVAIMPWEDQV